MKYTREFRFESKKSAPQVWIITKDGESYTTEHGLMGGAIQKFSDTPGPKGKEGTKAYVDAVVNCHFHVERECRKKQEHGYVEFVDGKPLTEQVNEIDFAKTLPKNFCPFKPKTSIELKAIKKVFDKGNARFSKKLDGMAHIAVHHPTGWEIYTRRMDIASERFPRHVEVLSKTDFEVGTILVGEMLCMKNGKEDFRSISRVCRSLPEQTRKLVEDKEVPEPQYMIYDVLFHNGKDLKNTKYDDRRKLWKNFPLLEQGELLCAKEYIDVTPDNWEQLVKEKDWEGLVFVDGSCIPGDKFYSFNGDPPRPSGHAKMKVVYEEDCIIFAGLVGTGKRLNGIGSVFLAQRNPEANGEYQKFGRCGSGFTDESLDELERFFKEKEMPIFEKEKDAAKVELIPGTTPLLVGVVEFPERMPKTHNFRFPVFLRLREDKTPEECFMQRFGPEED